MKKSFIVAGLLALMASTGAKAADIVTYQEQPVAAAAAPAAVNWNGVYVGGTIGGSWGSADTKLKGANGVEVNADGDYAFTNGRIAKKGIDPDTFIGGFYAGYNFQPNFLSNSFLKDIVFGVETDFLFNGDGTNGSKQFDIMGAGPRTYRASVKQKWNGATRIRAGYALGSEGRFLPYIAGGVSYADMKGRYSVSDYNDLGQAVRGKTYSKTKTRAGWNIGAGIDYVPPILNDHLVLRAEYRFTDFGSDTYGKTNVAMTNPDLKGSVKQKIDFNQNDFRVGVAYKF